MTRACSGRGTDRKGHWHRPVALRLALASLLIAGGFPASAQSVTDPAARPVLRQLARSSSGADGDQGMLRNAQFMPGMPQMQMPPMLAPRTGGSQGSMGSGMTMVMTGDTLLEMMAGACTAGLFIGGVAAAVATAPAAPVTVGVIASSAGIGCGFAMAATGAGMAGMMGSRAVFERFK